LVCERDRLYVELRDPKNRFVAQIVERLIGAGKYRRRNQRNFARSSNLSVGRQPREIFGAEFNLLRFAAFEFDLHNDSGLVESERLHFVGRGGEGTLDLCRGEAAHQRIDRRLICLCGQRLNNSPLAILLLEGDGFATASDCNRRYIIAIEREGWLRG